MNEAIKQDKKLGRGLSALLGDNKTKMQSAMQTASQSGRQDVIELISINKLVAGVYQPRRNFANDELHELADSIKEHGILQPLIVRKGDDEQHYEIIAGERRYRAAKLAELTKIPVIVKKVNNHEALELAIIENVQRSDLTLLEEANGYKQLMDEFSYNQEQVARKTGKSRSHIANMLRLLNLPNSVHGYLERRLISMGHARAIINSDNPEELAHKIVDAALTVRETEEIVREERVEKLKNVPAFVRTESQIKYINGAYISDLEEQLATLLDTNVKISYNQFKNKGKIAIDFSDVDLVKNLLEKLSN